MNNNHLSFFVRIIPFLVAGTLLTGCVTTRYDKGEGSANDLARAQKDLAQLKGQISATLAELDQLEKAKDDPRPAYKKFDKGIRDLELDTRETRDDIIHALARWNLYLRDWERELPQFQSNEVRARSQERWAALSATSEKISAALQAQQESSDRFLADLKDIKRYLNIDLSPSGITSIASLTGKARKSGEELQTRIDTTIQELGRVTAEFQRSAPK